ncbi:MAG: SGNH/GDSL hydrolase family protein [Candidatus Omnitrophica bacterium]|nr:SGNH/GDSL hydrolase family protein [Candidatus Omnitrophota bacterium]
MDNNFLFKNGETIVFIGDSITDCGRRDQFFPYGNGYAKMAVNLITARYPEKSFTYFNRGIGGDNVEGLHNRWHDDLILLKPDWVSILIGINDLHCFLADSTTLPPDRYEKLYRAILERTRQGTKAKLILLEPFYISRDFKGNNQRSLVLKKIPDYIKIVRYLAGEFDALLIKTHDIFQEQLKYRPADTFCPEPVHPNATGHLVIAHELLKAVNY